MWSQEGGVPSLGELCHKVLLTGIKPSILLLLLLFLLQIGLRAAFSRVERM
jgi:hypothetical protein